MARLRVRPAALKNAALIAGLLAFWFAAAAVAAVAAAPFVWLLIVIGLPLSLVTVLVATGSGARLFIKLLEGAAVGALATMLILVGVFFPYAARWEIGVMAWAVAPAERHAGEQVVARVALLHRWRDG